MIINAYFHEGTNRQIFPETNNPIEVSAPPSLTGFSRFVSNGFSFEFDENVATNGWWATPIEQMDNENRPVCRVTFFDKNENFLG